MTPQSQGVVFFIFYFTTVRSLSQQRNLCCDRIPLSCTPSLGAPTSSCAPDLVCRMRARLAWSVMRAWPSLSRRNTMPHCLNRESLLRAYNLVATQCLASVSQDITLCCDVYSLGPCSNLDRDKKILYRDLKSPVKAKICRDGRILYRDI